MEEKWQRIEQTIYYAIWNYTENERKRKNRKTMESQNKASKQPKCVYFFRGYCFKRLFLMSVCVCPRCACSQLRNLQNWLCPGSALSHNLSHPSDEKCARKCVTLKHYFCFSFDENNFRSFVFRLICTYLPFKVVFRIVYAVSATLNARTWALYHFHIAINKETFIKYSKKEK